MEAVGEPVGRSKCSLMWFKVLQAEISAIPGSDSGEISFRNLFLILTIKMQGADAMCQDVDGEIKTNVDQVLISPSTSWHIASQPYFNRTRTFEATVA